MTMHPLTTHQPPATRPLDPLDWELPSARCAGWVSQADTLAAGFAVDAATHDRAGTFPHAHYAALRTAAFHLLPIPAEYGGWAATLPEAVRIIEHLARGDGATALVFAMHLQTLGTAAETRPWPEANFARLCRDVVARGGLVNATASEPELGSPSRGGLPATTATWTGDGWRLHGRKTWASGSWALGHFLAPAVLHHPDLADGTVGIFDVRPEHGPTIEETWNVMGMRGTASHDLVLDDVLVSPDDLLQQKAPGAPDAGRTLGGAWFPLLVSAVYLGIAQAARDAAMQWASERRPTNLGGKAITTTEIVQGRLGTLEAELLTARSLLYTIADRWEQHAARRGALQAHLGLVKVTATTQAVRATDLALRIVGGSAMGRDLPLERLFRDVRAGLFHPPAEETAYQKLGQALFEYTDEHK